MCINIGDLQSVIFLVHDMQAANGGGDLHHVEDADADLQVLPWLHVHIDLLADKAGLVAAAAASAMACFCVGSNSKQQIEAATRREFVNMQAAEQVARRAMLTPSRDVPGDVETPLTVSGWHLLVCTLAAHTASATW
jgi:hypothetical protein